MIQKAIVYCGQHAVLSCDALCEKAWGINNRPRRYLSDDVDDFVYLADKVLSSAPIDPGTYEGVDAKPRSLLDRLNRWCARECERSRLTSPGEAVALPDFSNPRPNKRRRK